MNPTTETRYALVRYIVLWLAVAITWAAVFGPLAAQELAAAALDGAVFGTVCGFLGIQLWNVLKYGAEQIRIPFLRSAMHAVVGALFTAVVAGAGTVAAWLPTGGLSAEFAATIPARCLTIAAVYVCFVLWYRSAWAGDDDPKNDEAGTAAPAMTAEAQAGSADSADSEPADNGDGEGDDGKTAAAHPIDRVTVRGVGGRIEVISTDEIVCIQAEGDYVAIVTAHGRHLKEGTMKWFEQALPPARFVRVHRSCIVAVGRISRIETSGRDHTLTLRDGAGTIRISDTYYRILKQRLGL